MSKIIPVAQVPHGIEKCLKKSKKFFATAKDLVENGNPEEALIISVFGLEEFGRAGMLKEALKNAQAIDNDFIQIEKKKFYEHEAKQKTALLLLPKELVTLAIGTFNLYYRSDSIVLKDGKIDVLQDIREGVTYVDYRDSKWQSPPRIDCTGLKRFIEGVEKETEKFLKFKITYPEE
jgi:AbiV family abortive infection protein